MRFSRQQSETYRSFERRWGEVGYENLSILERKVVALEALEGDVMNGGLSQYFYNSSGDLATDALTALAELDARITHDSLQSALKKFWLADYPSNREDRYDTLLAAEDADEMLLDEETRNIQELPEDFLARALDKLAEEYAKHA